MPELGPSGDNFRKIQETRRSSFPETTEGANKHRKEFDDAVRGAGLDVVGAGVENVVVSYKDKVAALARYSGEADGLTPEARKARFYAQKVLHILFPQHFPKFHAVFHAPLSDTHMGEGTVRERIASGHEVGMDPEEDPLTKEAEILYNKLKELESYDIKIHDYLDLWGWNFHRVDEDVKYVDQIDGSFIQTEKDVENLERYMTDKGYSENEKRQAREFSKRAVELLHI